MPETILEAVATVQKLRHTRTFGRLSDKSEGYTARWERFAELHGDLTKDEPETDAAALLAADITQECGMMLEDNTSRVRRELEKLSIKGETFYESTADGLLWSATLNSLSKAVLSYRSGRFDGRAIAKDHAVDFLAQVTPSQLRRIEWSLEVCRIILMTDRSQGAAALPAKEGFGAFQTNPAEQSSNMQRRTPSANGMLKSSP